MVCEPPRDQSKRARVESPPGFGVSDGVLLEILGIVHNTDGQLKKMGRELDETKQFSAKAMNGHHHPRQSEEFVCWGGCLRDKRYSFVCRQLCNA